MPCNVQIVLHNIVVIDLLDASANNAVLEAISMVSFCSTDDPPHPPTLHTTHTSNQSPPNTSNQSPPTPPTTPSFLPSKSSEDEVLKNPRKHTQLQSERWGVCAVSGRLCLWLSVWGV